MVRSGINFLLLSVLLLCAFPARAEDVSQANKIKTYALLTADRVSGTSDLALVLTVKNGPEILNTLAASVVGGQTLLAEYDKWYEELFALTYLTGDYSRLWKSLRAHNEKMTGQFLAPDMIQAVRGVDLLIVADRDFPFPADVFRVNGQWLFEIAPIIHTVGVPESIPDLSDAYDYKDVLILDCQGPDDREGAEAPGVAAFLDNAGISHKFLVTLTSLSAEKALEEYSADVLHLATHANPDEFFPGRGKSGIAAARLMQLPTRFRTVLSTGCNTGHPVFAHAMLDDGTRFFIASMYKTSGKDGIVFGGDFYTHLFSGKTPFESFYEVKKRITGKQPDYPDILRFVFYAK